MHCVLSTFKVLWWREGRRSLRQGAYIYSPSKKNGQAWFFYSFWGEGGYQYFFSVFFPMTYENWGAKTLKNISGVFKTQQRGMQRKKLQVERSKNKNTFDIENWVKRRRSPLISVSIDFYIENWVKGDRLLFTSVWYILKTGEKETVAFSSSFRYKNRSKPIGLLLLSFWYQLYFFFALLHAIFRVDALYMNKLFDCSYTRQIFDSSCFYFSERGTEDGGGRAEKTVFLLHASESVCLRSSHVWMCSLVWSSLLRIWSLVRSSQVWRFSSLFNTVNKYNNNQCFLTTISYPYLRAFNKKKKQIEITLLCIFSDQKDLL